MQIVFEKYLKMSSAESFTKHAERKPLNSLSQL